MGEHDDASKDFAVMMSLELVLGHRPENFYIISSFMSSTSFLYFWI